MSDRISRSTGPPGLRPAGLSGAGLHDPLNRPLFAAIIAARSGPREWVAGTLFASGLD